MAFLVKRADPKTALLNSVPAGEYVAKLVGVGEPTYYGGTSHKLKLPLRFQIDGYTGGVVLRRIPLEDRNGEAYAEFGPNTEMVRFLDVAGVQQPDEAIGMRFVVKVARRGEFCDVVDVIRTCSQQMHPTDVPHIPTPPVIGNSLFVTREWEPECTPQTYPTHTFTDKDKGADMSRRGQFCPKNGQEPEAPLSSTARLTHASRNLPQGPITFRDSARKRLEGLLPTYTPEEIEFVFVQWIGDEDFSNPKVHRYADVNFAERAADLLSSARVAKQEREAYQARRDAHARRFQAEAEEERRAAETKRREEENFDPLADLLCASA